MTANCRSKSTDSPRGHGASALAYGAHGVLVLVVVTMASVSLRAQGQQPAPSAQSIPPAAAAAAAPRPTDPPLPPGYVIGPDDVLSVVYWRDKHLSAEARVGPDGRLALPLINEVVAAGLTPEQLQKRITEESKKYMEDANITIVVREINSRRVFIVGEVAKAGPYPLISSMTVMQLISVAGGLRDYANSKNITIMRNEGDRQVSLKFNYKEVAAGKNLAQNIELKPGDTVVVP